MKDFKKIEIEEDVHAYVGQFSISETTNILDQFKPLWTKIEAQDEKMIHWLFIGIDVGRSAFLDIFKSDDNFKKQPRFQKNKFLYAINAALTKAIKEGELPLANGISFYILWTVAMIQEDYKASEYIESQFAELRNEHNL